MEAKSKITVLARPFLCFAFVLLSKAFSQVPQKLSDHRVLLLGDVHIDTPYSNKIKLSSDDLNCASEFLNNIPDENRLYLLEAPLSTQYYFRKYLETGDFSFLNIIQDLQHEINFIQHLKQKKNIRPGEFFCYDSDTKPFEKTLVNVLFYLLLYEPYKNNCTGDFRNTEQNYSFYYKSLTQNERIIDSLNLSGKTRSLNNLIWNCKFRARINTKKVRQQFASCLSDSLFIRDLKIIVHSDHSYFIALLKSYVQSVKFNLKKNSDFNRRESDCFTTITTILNSAPGQKALIKCGIYHTQSHDSLTLASKITQSYKVAFIQIMYKAFAKAYPSYLQPYFNLKVRGMYAFGENEYLFFCE